MDRFLTFCNSIGITNLSGIDEDQQKRAAYLASIIAYFCHIVG